jgi:hypothetical protein
MFIYTKVIFFAMKTKKRPTSTAGLNIEMLYDYSSAISSAGVNWNGIASSKAFTSSSVSSATGLPYIF